MFRYSPNRYICDILTDMRTSVEKLRIDLIPGLIEEVQIYGNRMEARLNDQRDVKELLEDKSRLNDEVAALKKEKETLEKQIDKEKEE